MLLSQPAAGIDPDTADLSGRTVVLTADDGYRSIYRVVYPLLKRYDFPMTLSLIGVHLTRGRSPYRPADRFMNAAEVQEMIDSCGIEVASHSLSHPRLTEVDSGRVWYELRQSKLLLESMFGTPVVTFVYPGGRSDERVRRMVAEAGYLLARSVRPGNPNFGLDPYRLPEVELRDTTSFERVRSYIRRHRVTVVMMHNVVLTPEAYTDCPARQLAALMSWMHDHRVKVVTLGELYRTWWRRKVTRELLELIEAEPKPARPQLFEQVNVDATGTSHPR